MMTGKPNDICIYLVFCPIVVHIHTQKYRLAARGGKKTNRCKNSISFFVHGMMNPKLPLLYPTYA
jgi:hypothetical protein